LDSIEGVTEYADLLVRGEEGREGDQGTRAIIGMLDSLGGLKGVTEYADLLVRGEEGHEGA
jgi:hypothetical protein